MSSVNATRMCFAYSFAALVVIIHSMFLSNVQPSEHVRRCQVIVLYRSVTRVTVTDFLWLHKLTQQHIVAVGSSCSITTTRSICRR